MALIDIFGGTEVPLFFTDTSYEDAIDEIFGRFWSKWKTQSTAIAGYVPTVQWVGVELDEKPDVSKFSIRTSNTTVDERQTSLRGDSGTRYDTVGVLLMQLYCPKTAAGRTIGKKLATLARDIFRGKRISKTVKFEHVRIVELEPTEKHNRFNILANYNYFTVVTN